MVPSIVLSRIMALSVTQFVHRYPVLHFKGSCLFERIIKLFHVVYRVWLIRAIYIVRLMSNNPGDHFSVRKSRNLPELGNCREKILSWKTFFVNIVFETAPVFIRIILAYILEMHFLAHCIACMSRIIVT